jgi:hypothetical protein
MCPKSCRRQPRSITSSARASMLDILVAPARAAIEPDANFVLAGGFELGDPPFFFVQHALPKLRDTG